MIAILALLLASAAVGADDGVAARVNGTPIPNAMVNLLVKSLIAGDKKPPRSEIIAIYTAMATDQYIDAELLWQAAQANGIQVSDAEVDAEIANSRKRYKSDADYRAALALSGLTLEQVRDDTRRVLGGQKYVEEMARKQATATGKAINPDEWRSTQLPELRRAARIETPTPVGVSITPAATVPPTSAAP